MGVVPFFFGAMLLFGVAIMVWESSLFWDWKSSCFASQSSRLAAEIRRLEDAPGKDDEMVDKLRLRLKLMKAMDKKGGKLLEDLKEEINELRQREKSHIMEIQNLLRQIGVRDKQLDSLSGFVEQLPVASEEYPTEAELQDWKLQNAGGSGKLVESGFFSKENYRSLRQVLVAVATGQNNHKTRAVYHLQSWVKLMPNPIFTVKFFSDADDSILSPIPVVILKPSTRDKALDNEYHAAQSRFLRGLSYLAEKDFGKKPPHWVLVVDDDTFVIVPNLLRLILQLNATSNSFYSEVCSSQANIAFSCGGGGILIPMVALRRAHRSLRSCYLANGGPMGQYDVALSHCMFSTGCKATARDEFCSQPPSYYKTNEGKGPEFNITQFKNAVTFHYIKGPSMISMYQDVLAQKPIWQVP